jgi:L-amino acid N-acyltransferase YncA
VRPASTQDAAARLASYRPCVLDTPISWEIDVPTVGEMAARIAGLHTTHEWLVLEKRLAALQWPAEAGVYVDVQRHRAGGGRELYTQLLRRLTDRGYNPTRPATPFIDPSGSGTLAHTVARHGCNSICLRPAVRMDRPARFADPRSAGDGPLRNRQGAMPPTAHFAKVDPWTRHPPAVHIDTCEYPEKNLRPRFRTLLCPQWDSNPHWADFKSAASADWAMGASDECSAWLLKPSPGVPKRLVGQSRVLKIPSKR